MVGVERDAAPQHLHGRGVARVLGDARAAELQHLAGIVDRSWLDVVLGRRIEAAHLRRRSTADQAIGADDAFRALAAAAVEHQQVIAHLVERIEVAALRRHLRRRMRRHLFVEDAIAQRLRGVDFGSAVLARRTSKSPATTLTISRLEIGGPRSSASLSARSMRMFHPQGGRPDHPPIIGVGDEAVHSFLSVGFAVQGHAVQFQTMADQPVAGLFGDPALQFLDLVVVEFDDLAALDVDQVIVVLARAFPRSARGRRRNRAWRECRPPRTAAPSGTPSRWRCWDRSRSRACAPPRHPDGRGIRTARARSRAAGRSS